MRIAGMTLEVVGAAAIAYALYTVAPWAGMLAAGVIAILIGSAMGSSK